MCLTLVAFVVILRDGYRDEECHSDGGTLRLQLSVSEDSAASRSYTLPSWFAFSAQHDERL